MRYTDEDLKGAAANGILAGRAAEKSRPASAFRHILAGADEKAFRLPDGFNEIFVSFAILFTLTAALLLLNMAQPMLAGPFVTLAAWVLAEHFTRQLRMALPSIVLMLMFCGTIGWYADDAVATKVLDDAATAWVPLAAGLAASAVAALAHWFRFKVPITICALTIAALYTVFVLLIAACPGLKPFEPAMFLGIGCILFCFGLWWDFGDPTRRTRHAAVAFWLHLAAAPMIVYPMIQMLRIFGPSAAGTARPLLAVAIYFALGIVALIIDRRAMLVSGFVVLSAVGMSIGASAGNVGGVGLAGLLVGGGLLMTSIWWRSLRALVLRGLPGAARRWLPPARARSPTTP